MAAPRWVALANEIRDQIGSGLLKPGDKLPSTAQLCAMHQVSTIVVRNAMISLKARGLVDGVAGVGVFVSRDLPADGLRRAG